MHSRTAMATVAAIILVSPLALGGQNPAAVKNSGANGPRIIVPAETEIPIRLSSSISSRAAYVGQHFYGRTFYPITVGNFIAIPVGTYVKGTITQVKRRGLIRGNALIRLRCDTLTFPNGTTLRLDTMLEGVGGNQALDRRGEPAVEGAKRSVGTRDVRTIAETTGTGALIGVIITGTRLGAGLGALGGGLTGLAAVMATRRKAIVLPPGSDLEFQLTQPLTFNRSVIDSSPDSPKGPAIPPLNPGPGL